jgi:hypothetical protein
MKAYNRHLPQTFTDVLSGSQTADVSFLAFPDPNSFVAGQLHQHYDQWLHIASALHHDNTHAILEWIKHGVSIPQSPAASLCHTGSVFKCSSVVPMVILLISCLYHQMFKSLPQPTSAILLALSYPELFRCECFCARSIYPSIHGVLQSICFPSRYTYWSTYTFSFCVCYFVYSTCSRNFSLKILVADVTRQRPGIMQTGLSWQPWCAINPILPWDLWIFRPSTFPIVCYWVFPWLMDTIQYV